MPTFSPSVSAGSSVFAISATQPRADADLHFFVRVALVPRRRHQQGILVARGQQIPQQLIVEEHVAS